MPHRPLVALPRTLQPELVGWELGTRFRFLSSVPGRGLELAVWRQPEGLWNSASWAGKQSAIAERAWEEAWASRRSQPPLLGRVRRGGMGVP